MRQRRDRRMSPGPAILSNSFRRSKLKQLIEK
jgi:hypothetical protein